ncbi:MAG: DNA gyrase inhibitor YacG [Acidobacteriaceae bacterium]
MPKSAKPKALRCPTCHAIVLPKDEDFPFCSDRCRRIDLGKWASGAYKISSPILDPEVLEGLEEGHRANRSREDDDDHHA